MYIYMYMYTCLHTVTIHRAEDHIRKSYLTWRNPMRKMGGDLFDEKESTSEGNMSKRVSTMLLPKKWWSSSHGACLNQEFMMMFKFIFHYIPNQTYIYIAFQLQESGFLLRITCKTYMFHFQTIPWICYETSQKKNMFPTFQVWHSSFATVTGDMTSSTAMPLSLSRADFGEIAPRHRVPCTSCVLQESWPLIAHRWKKYAHIQAKSVRLYIAHRIT